MGKVVLTLESFQESYYNEFNSGIFTPGRPIGALIDENKILGINRKIDEKEAEDPEEEKTIEEEIMLD